MRIADRGLRIAQGEGVRKTEVGTQESGVHGRVAANIGRDALFAGFDTLFASKSKWRLQFELLSIGKLRFRPTRLGQTTGITGQSPPMF